MGKMEFAERGKINSEDAEMGRERGVHAASSFATPRQEFRQGRQNIEAA
jgi:hypothetical protein